MLQEPELVGTYERTLDAKGRLVLPLEWRRYLGAEVMLFCGERGRVVVLPIAHLDAVDHLDLHLAFRVPIGANGRVLLPPWVRDYAEIKSGAPVLMSGYGGYGLIGGMAGT